MRYISNAVFWTALGAIAALLITVIYLVIARIMAAEHRLNRAKTLPKISGLARIEKKQIAHTFKHFVIIEVKNDGDLPAIEVNGNWHLVSPTSLQDESLPVSIAFLGKSPVQLEPKELRGERIRNAINSGEDIRIDVDFDLEFISFEDKKDTCKDQYRYDRNIKNLVRVAKQ